MFPGLPTTYPPMGQTHRPMGDRVADPPMGLTHRPMGDRVADPPMGLTHRPMGDRVADPPMGLTHRPMGHDPGEARIHQWVIYMQAILKQRPDTTNVL